MKNNVKWIYSLFISHWLLLALCLMCFGHFLRGHSVASDSLSVTEILERIQRRYDVTDFEADFNQQSRLKAMDIVDTAQGHVSFRPPAMMRWHYKTPENYILIINTEKLWIYWPEENQVMVGKATDYLGNTGLAEFFAEPTKLLNSFHIEQSNGEFARKGLHALKLTPKKMEPNIDKAYLLVAEETFDVVELITYNTFGDETRIRFSGLRFNLGLDPSLFEFKIPENADVLQLQTGDQP